MLRHSIPDYSENIEVPITTKDLYNGLKKDALNIKKDYEKAMRSLVNKYG